MELPRYILLHHQFSTKTIVPQTEMVYKNCMCTIGDWQVKSSDASRHTLSLKMENNARVFGFSLHIKTGKHYVLQDWAIHDSVREKATEAGDVITAENSI